MYPLTAATLQITMRAVLAVMYGGELYAELEHAERSFKKLQEEWARAVHGCGSAGRIAGILAVSQCAWKQCLGTRFLEEVLLARAAARLLPAANCALGRQSHAITWVLATVRILRSSQWPQAIPDIDIPCESTISEASLSNEARKSALAAYRANFLQPEAFDCAAKKELPALGCCCNDFRAVFSVRMPPPDDRYVAPVCLWRRGPPDGITFALILHSPLSDHRPSSGALPQHEGSP